MIEKIRLSNFRNFKDKIFKFSPKISVIIGPNASGKTNILESLFLLSTGKSFRAHIEEEMIGYNAEIARIKGRIYADGQSSNLEILLTRGEIKIGDSKFEKAPRKRLLINGVGKRLVDFAGNLKVTLFGPWDLDLVTESPSLRRRFLDYVLSQVDRDYRRASLSYEKGLRQRNKILWRMREENLPGQRPISPSWKALRAGSRAGGQLLFWDKLLIKNGDYISQKREEFIEFANSSPQLQTTLRARSLEPMASYQLFYDKSAISETRLEQYADEEVAAATTLVGPHRDDFVFNIGKWKMENGKSEPRDLAHYGSRGEARMAVLWLKLAELAYVEEKVGEKPILLLDDIFSELDHEHRKIVMGVVNEQQTVITTADPHFIEQLKVDSLIDLNSK